MILDALAVRIEQIRHYRLGGGPATGTAPLHEYARLAPDLEAVPFALELTKGTLTRDDFKVDRGDEPRVLEKRAGDLPEFQAPAGG